LLAERPLVSFHTILFLLLIIKPNFFIAAQADAALIKKHNLAQTRGFVCHEPRKEWNNLFGQKRFKNLIAIHCLKVLPAIAITKRKADAFAN
jgi:hypothetical protein